MSNRTWIANGPEDRLSIAVNRFLHDTLLPPFYCTAIHDRDGGQRSMLQRTRDLNRGIKKGQLDWIIDQGPPHLNRRLELKRGKNDLTEEQGQTTISLAECGAPPIVAWTLEHVYEGLYKAGFYFLPNVRTKLDYYDAQLAAWDREAELIKSGAVVRKPTKQRAPRAAPGKIRAAERVRARVLF